MKKELKSGILSADKSADGRPTVGGVNVIAVLHSTLSRLHHRLPKSFKADAISSLHLLKSIWEGNLYFGPFETILRILESGIILRFPVIT